MPDWEPTDDGLRDCSYCFRRLPLAEMERHEVTYANKQEPKRTIVWFVCRDGSACHEARPPRVK